MKKINIDKIMHKNGIKIIDEISEMAYKYMKSTGIYPTHITCNPITFFYIIKGIEYIMGIKFKKNKIPLELPINGTLYQFTIRHDLSGFGPFRDIILSDKKLNQQF